MIDLLPKSPYESHLSRQTSEYLKNIIKILGTRPKSSKNAKKWIKMCKIHDVDKSTLLFDFNSFLCSILEPSTENKIFFGKNCFENLISDQKKKT